ncbi:hypothetical protein [Chitinophaga pinensis]|uniref:Uncharacterized protein n=1 Tax=Chitinophaga pinensis (strain ATCC 43595 / DSM 2588 / LMG 13176 / NBRC 15968 / NCIMB 11800 / UQM 2034) TaxID=485918 RepID=A0A979G7B5_CHIPD|nr:hypothetical protein [Chitinophaga pinensis]ACU62023.1 hypothetical protein Cpin_4581 [Chitinophaga pinensis DSM 2588]
MSSITYSNESGDIILFDPETYLAILKACLQEFFGKSEESASDIIGQSGHLSLENFPPKDFNQMALLDHLTIFDFAYNMLRDLPDPSLSSYAVLPMDTYLDWEEDFIQKNELNPDYILYEGEDEDEGEED